MHGERYELHMTSVCIRCWNHLQDQDFAAGVAACLQRKGGYGLVGQLCQCWRPAMCYNDVSIFIHVWTMTSFSVRFIQDCSGWIQDVGLIAAVPWFRKTTWQSKGVGAWGRGCSAENLGEGTGEVQDWRGQGATKGRAKGRGKEGRSFAWINSLAIQNHSELVWCHLSCGSSLFRAARVQVSVLKYGMPLPSPAFPWSSLGVNRIMCKVTAHAFDHLRRWGF